MPSHLFTVTDAHREAHTHSESHIQTGANVSMQAEMQPGGGFVKAKSVVVFVCAMCVYTHAMLLQCADCVL